MEEKLKLILKKIHWSLVLRAIAFGVAWLVFPFWAFLLMALYFYFVPLFRPRNFALPFLVLIFFTATEPTNIWLAILFSVLFYLILGIKDFILINRNATHEVLTLLLLFLIFIRFFSEAPGLGSISTLFYSLGMGVLLFLLTRGFMAYGARLGISDNEVRRRNVLLAVVAFVVWQISFALLFAPLNFLYQSALLFVATTLSLEFVIDYLGGKLTRRRILTNFSVFLVFFVGILGSAQWGL